MDEKRARALITLMKYGHCPSPWAHHPAVIKRALRALRMTPMRKQCFRNCQRFMIGIDGLGLRLDLKYVEGLICHKSTPSILLPHAWLLHDGKVLDLTIPDGEYEIEYRSVSDYSMQEILVSVVSNMAYMPINERRLFESMPLGKIH